MTSKTDNEPQLVSPPIRMFAIVGASLCLISFIIFQYFAFYPIDRNLGHAAVVRYTPFYTAGKYLATHSIEISQERDLSLLNAPIKNTDSIILAAKPGHINKKKLSHLKSWINEGGQLIYWANRKFESDDDPILGLLQASLYEDKLIKQDQDLESFINITEEILPGIGKLKIQEQKPISLKFDDSNITIDVGFDPRWYLADLSDQARYYTQESRDHILDYDYGKGNIVLLSDMQFWLNPNIGQFDHAFFLKTLISNNRNISFIFGGEHESILEKLRKLALPLISALLVLFIFWVWRSIPRLGPIKKLNLYQRRHIGEHIKSSAHLRWQQGQQQQWIDSLLAEIKKSAAKRNPQFSAMNTRSQIEWLKQISDLPESDIAALFEQSSSLDENQFLLFTHNLQILKKSL